jgi:hypothetical protein
MNCIQCDTPFTKSSYISKQLCSRKCNDSYTKKINTVEKLCPMCDKYFTSDKRKNRIVCSVSCANKYQKTEQVLQRKRELTKSSLMEKYGVEHNSQIEGFTKNRQKTMITKYGVPHFTNKEKAQKTLIERYGDSKYNNKEKTKQTMKDKYGVESFSQSPLFKKKLKEKYGVEHPMMILKNRKSAFSKVISKITAVTPLFDFDTYNGVHGSSGYPFRCNTCNNEFNARLDDGNIPICRVCNPIIHTKSKCEYEIIDWLKTVYTGEIIHGDKSVLNGKEIDVYLPTENLGIELNGLYYHGEICGGKKRNYHLNKTQRCATHGITLLHVLDIEWINKRDIVQSILLNKIKASKSNGLHGRNCIVREISPRESNEFLIKNHIQGEDKSSVRIGLYHNDEIVSVLTFGKNRFSKETEWEMYRFCSNIHTHVRGGLDKMFSYFVSMYKPSSILTFSDRRYFDGSVYGKIGFKFVGVTPPNYHYFKINDHKTVFGSRNKFQKHKLSSLLETFDSSLTEWENMQLNGYDRIWDCGSSKWIWTTV